MIEDTFGLRWLEKKARQLANGNSRIHPIVRLWILAKQTLANATATRQMGFGDDLVFFFDLGSALKTVRQLPGFSRALTAARLKNPAWEKDCYVAHIAAVSVNGGYEVEFLAPADSQSVRTADLLLRNGQRRLHVECKKKDAYAQPKLDEDAWNAAAQKLTALHPALTCDYEVVVCALSVFDPSSTKAIVDLVSAVIGRNEEGEFSGGAPDCVVFIKRAPPRPPGVSGLWLSKSKHPTEVMSSVSIGSNGEPVYGSSLRCTLYLIDGHKLGKVLNTFNDARCQIPADALGLIYIDLDVSRIELGDHELYFRTIDEWLRKQFRSKANTRIAAVVLTGGIAKVDVEPNGGFHRTARWRWVIRNLFRDSDVRIPGD